MTVTIQNVDSTLLQLLKSAVALKPNTYIITEEKDPIKEEIEKDIELYKQGKLKTLALEEMKKECSSW